MRTLCAAVLVLLLGSSTSFADKAYKSVPTEAAAHGSDAAEVAAKTGLDLRVVSYDGATNGELTVEVKNAGKEAKTFIATGLYFVPDGKADEAPQRLGAVGPMQIAGEANGKRVDKLVVAPGKAVQVKLDVFCIDSHRSSPSSKNTFTLGSKRLPAKLRSSIETNAKAVIDRNGGYAAPAANAPAAKSQVQSEVWQARDAEWVEIDGESKQEAGKKAGGARNNVPMNNANVPRRVHRVPAQIENNVQVPEQKQK